MIFINILETLKSLDIPICLRCIAGTDGSVTRLLEIITKKSIKIATQEQYVISADKAIANLLDVDIGSEVNHRIVTLSADGVKYVYAKSLAPLNRMPFEMKLDLMRADIPIGNILRNYQLETRRDIYNLTLIDAKDHHLHIFNNIPLLSKKYKIIHNKKVLMWINEIFPIDDRWNL